MAYSGHAQAEGVLARIVADRGLQPEPVATDALTHLLVGSADAAQALTGLATALVGAAMNTPLTFSTQASAADAAGRPDLLGVDASGPRLVGEAKFDASLTEHQQGTAYLDRLPTGQPGVLLFIVPEDRLAVIWPQLLRGPGALAAVPSPSTVVVTDGTVTHHLGDGRVLAAVTWPRLLSVLRQAVELSGDTSDRSDLEQLDGLVRWRTRTGWLPLAAGDLPDTAGRQLAGVRNAVLRAASQVSAAKVRNGSGDGGPGRWFKTPGGRWLWAGFWLNQWDRGGISPAWATVSASSDTSFAAITDALKPLDELNGVGRFRTAPRQWAVPLSVPFGVEVDQATGALASQLQQFAALVDQAVGAEVTSEPDVPAAEDDPPPEHAT